MCLITIFNFVSGIIKFNDTTNPNNTRKSAKYAIPRKLTATLFSLRTVISEVAK